MSILIDIHAHIFPEKVASKAVSNISQRYCQEAHYQGVFSEYIGLLADAQFTCGVVSTAATRPEQVTAANDWALELNKHPLLKALGTIHLDYPDWQVELDRIQEAGLKGMKLHPDFQRFYPDDPRAMELYSYLPDGFVLLFHVGDDPSIVEKRFAQPQRIAKVVEAFPNLNIIAAHMGGYRQWEEAKKWLIGTGAYLDTSSAASFLDPQEFVEMVRTHGYQRILFGSDYPFRGPGEDKAALAELGLTDRELRAIMGENAAQLPIFS